MSLESQQQLPQASVSSSGHGAPPLDRQTSLDWGPESGIGVWSPGTGILSGVYAMGSRISVWKSECLGFRIWGQWASVYDLRLKPLTQDLSMESGVQYLGSGIQCLGFRVENLRSQLLALSVAWGIFGP